MIIFLHATNTRKLSHVHSWIFWFQLFQGSCLRFFFCGRVKVHTFDVQSRRPIHISWACILFIRAFMQKMDTVMNLSKYKIAHLEKPNRGNPSFFVSTCIVWCMDNYQAIKFYRSVLDANPYTFTGLWISIKTKSLPVDIKLSALSRKELVISTNFSTLTRNRTHHEYPWKDRLHCKFERMWTNGLSGIISTPKYLFYLCPWTVPMSLVLRTYKIMLISIHSYSKMFKEYNLVLSIKND